MAHLLTSRRFLPLFVTQFLGAFNDNLFKNALVILVTYKLMAGDGAASAGLVNLASGLFILPFLLFSYLAGQISDKLDRARVARAVKLAEIALASLAGLALCTGSIPLLLLTLFGFGAHSAFFGPVKYAILPQHLAENELIAGNGYIETSTFIAILAGTILGGNFILAPGGSAAIALAMVGVAVVGYCAATKIPAAPAPVPAMKLAWNPWRETLRIVGFSRGRREEFLCILGISWFWFVGAVFLTQFPPFAKDVLHADNHVVTLFLAVFAIGIAAGSVLCAKLLKGRITASLVPLGALGISVFACDLFLTSRYGMPSINGEAVGLASFLQQGKGLHIVGDLLGMALCGGVYTIPLYALLQARADREHIARTIASNNIVNAIFGVAAAILGIVLIKAGFSIPDIFLVVALLNLAVAIYICKLLPFSLIGAFLKLLYRVEVRGLENWAKAGDRVLVIANHTAYLDAAVIAAFLPERVSFAVNTHMAQKWWMKPLLKLVDTYALDPTNPMAAKSLIDRIKQNRKCMIFPEGRLTMTGSLMKVYEGPGMIADKSGAMILPVRIDGAQYSPFSRLKGKVRIRLFPKVTLTFLPPHKFALPDNIKGRRRRQLAGLQLYDVMSQMIFDSSSIDSTLARSLLDARHINGGKHIILEDQSRTPMDYNGFVTRSFALSRLIGRTINGKEQRIGLMLPNTTITAITFFAVQVMGRVTAMINFTAGPTQIRSACKAGEIKTIITSERFVQAAKLTPVTDALKADGIRVITLEDLQKDLRMTDRLFGLIAKVLPFFTLSLMNKAKPGDAAVMLFTSGSEGTPKGVMLSHRNILANRYQLSSRIDFGAQDVVFNCLPMFHAFGLTGGTLLPLLSGVKIFLYPSPLHYRVVPELIYDTNATILFGTDTFLSGYARFANPYDFYALRYVFAGAERLKEDTRRLWMDKYGVRIFEGYGATETTPVISVNTAMHYRAGSVGRFMPGISVRLENVPGIENGQKLLVSGPNVMLGYMKDDAPGILQPLEDAWYDTGDIVSIDAEGYITIMGRTKRFAKIGGEMISLTAVEIAVTKIWPGSNHAVVSVPDAKKGEALVLLTDNETAELDGMAARFRELGLTELAVPRRVIHLKSLPLLGTGKTDYIKARMLALEPVETAMNN